MSTGRFEDLIAWQKARILTKNVYELTSRPPMSIRRRFCEQFEAAAISIMNNVAEGYDRGGRADFARFLTIAKGSCGEVRSMSYVAFDSGLVSESQHLQILRQTDEIARVINGLRASVERQKLSKTPKSPTRPRPRTDSPLVSRLSSPETNNSELRHA